MSKEILNELKQIKRALTCQGSSSLDTYANDTFQITDCAGLPIGTPQNIKKTVVLNTTTTNICNVQEIADAINAIAPTTYNTNTTQIATNNVITLAATTYHSVSVAVLSGSVTIDVNGVSFTAPAGYNNMWKADTLLTNVITITSASVADVAIIDTIN